LRPNAGAVFYSQMAAPPLVELRDVTKRFGKGPLVLDGITLSAQPGEFISLIGPSGCGKSTLLRLLGGLAPITSGTLTIAQRRPEHIDELAMVFQDATLLPWLTVARNIELPLTLRGTPAAERASIRHRALELVRLADKARAYPRQLSGGQKMRVALARALSLSPHLLLLDEPFGALDEITREHLNEELLALHREQAWTAFFVTHSVAEAVFLSHRIFVFAANPGRIHAEITVDLPQPRTPETRLTPAYHTLVATVSRALRSVETATAA
jgi:NitT/TauT family transport system ATP-binding protein